MSENNPYCHQEMVCHEGCRCSSSDGTCHCPMLDDKKCACNGHCGSKRTDTI